MVLFSLGLPSRFADWCDALTERIIKVALGAVTVISADTPEEFAAALLRMEGGNLFVSGRQPGAWLGRVLATTERPFIVSLGDPRKIVWELVSRHGLDLADATRRVSASCASIMSCLRQPQALILNENPDWQQPAATAEAIARHFGLDLDPIDIAQIVDDTITSSAVLDIPLLVGASSTEQLNDRGAVVVDGAVGPYPKH